MPDYTLLKILHMTAAALVIIGVLLSSFTVARPPAAARLASIRRWDRFVTAPALGAVWILGIIIGLSGNWFSSGWLPVKLVFVLILSALHGMQAGGMRRLARGEAAPSFLRFSPYIALVSIAAIVLLASAKPF